MATNPYVNKVVFGNSTVMDISDTDATEREVLRGKKFYLGSGAPAVGTAIGGVPEEELRDTVGWTGKNLFNNNGADKSVNGITFTVNSDGTVTVNGTATATSFWGVQFTIPSGSYILNGCPVNGSGDTYLVDIRDAVGGSGISGINADIGAGSTFTLDSPLTAYLNIRIASGFTANNIVVKPMIRYAIIADNTYEPYHETVDEAKADREDITTVVGWSGKNLFDSSYVSQTKNGITFTVNSDKSITANGTASADTYIECVFKLKKGTYTFSGVTGGSYATYYIDYVNTDDQTLIVNINDGDKTVTLNSDVEIRAYLDIRSGYVASNLTFRPMVRKASISDDTYEPYHSSVDECKYNRSESNVLGAKNLLNLPTITHEGVTTSKNADGTYQCSGTTSNNAFRVLDPNTNFMLPVGKYIFSNTSSDGHSIRLAYVSESWTTLAEISSGSESEIEITQAMQSGSLGITMRDYTSGNTVNTIIKPMLRLASDPDDTYVPYAKTNKELTDAITPTPSASVNETSVVDAVNGAILEGGKNDEIPTLYGMSQWSNTVTKKYFVQGIAGSSTPIGRSGIGNWCVDGSDETGWITIPELVGIGSLDHSINITYDPAKSGMILKGGYIIDDTTGKMAIKFANKISEADTHTAKIGIEITIARAQSNPVSF